MTRRTILFKEERAINDQLDSTNPDLLSDHKKGYLEWGRTWLARHACRELVNYPDLRYVKSNGEDVVNFDDFPGNALDVGSLYERLHATNFDSAAWKIRAFGKRVGFLVELANTANPEEPLIIPDSATTAAITRSSSNA